MTTRVDSGRAGCDESRTSGSASGPGKRTGPKGQHRAPVRLNVFSSPHIIRRLGKLSGEVYGIDELRAYWGSGLQAETDLRFVVEDVRFSVDTIVINHRNQRGHAVAEALRFRDGLVCWGCGSYAPS